MRFLHSKLTGISLYSAVVLWCLWVLVSFSGKPVLNNNIADLLPANTVNAKVDGLKSTLSDRFRSHFSIFVAAKNEQSALVYSKDLQRQLFDSGQVQFLDLNAQLEQLKTTYFKYRHQLLDKRFRNTIHGLSENELAQLRVKEILSPLQGQINPSSFLEDPFNLSGQWLSALYADTPSFKPTEIPSLRVNGQTWYVVQGQFTSNTLSPDTSQLFERVLGDFNSSSTKIDLRLSGLVFHTTAGTELARQEIGTMGLISIVSVLIIFISFFRSWVAFGLITSTMIGSGFVGFCMCLYVFSSVHVITLIFGSTLLGMVVDYCFHFLVKYQSQGSATVALGSVRKGVFIGILTSTLAYGVQLFTPFPALQQFAVFIGAGLMFSALHLYVLALFIPDGQAQQPRVAHRCFEALCAGVRFLYKPKRVVIIAFLALIPLFCGIVYFQSNDSISAMNTSPKELIESEVFVRSAVKAASTQQYLLVEAASENQLLTKIAFVEKSLLAEGIDLSPSSVLKYIPPTEQRQQDFDLIQAKLSGEKGAISTLCAYWLIDCKQAITSVTFEEGLSLAYVKRQLVEYFPLLSLVSTTTSLIPIPDTAIHVLPNIKRLVATIDGVSFVDETARINQQLREYRELSSLLIGGFMVVITLLTAVFFGVGATRIFVTPVICVVLSLAVVAPFGLSLFHILAGLLVLGLTLDASAFYYSAGFNADTWWASLLSALTSLMVFGILGYSDVPMLEDFGRVVFVGVLISVLVAPFVFWNRLGQVGSKHGY